MCQGEREGEFPELLQGLLFGEIEQLWLLSRASVYFKGVFGASQVYIDMGHNIEGPPSLD